MKTCLSQCIYRNPCSACPNDKSLNRNVSSQPLLPTKKLGVAATEDPRVGDSIPALATNSRLRYFGFAQPILVFKERRIQAPSSEKRPMAIHGLSEKRYATFMMDPDTNALEYGCRGVAGPIRFGVAAGGGW